MTRRKLILLSTLVVTVFATTLLYVWSWGYNTGFVDGRREALCGQSRLNYSMALLLDNHEMIVFSKQALDECCGGNKNGR